MEFTIKMSEKEYENFKRDIMNVLTDKDNKNVNEVYIDLKQVWEYFGIKII